MGNFLFFHSKSSYHIGNNFEDNSRRRSTLCNNTTSLCSPSCRELHIADDMPTSQQRKTQGKSAIIERSTSQPPSPNDQVAFLKALLFSIVAEYPDLLHELHLVFFITSMGLVGCSTDRVRLGDMVWSVRKREGVQDTDKVLVSSATGASPLAFTGKGLKLTYGDYPQETFPTPFLPVERISVGMKTLLYITGCF